MHSHPSHDSVPLQDSDSSHAHLSQMFTAIISNLDRDSRESLCHVLHHCHTRLSPSTHLPVMFFSERDDVTYAIAAPHLTEPQNTSDRPNSELCESDQHAWSEAQKAAVRVLNDACVLDATMPRELRALEREEVRSAPRTLRRQRENYSAYAGQRMSDSESDDADDFDDDLSYDSYISDSKMSDVTEETEEFEEHCGRNVFGGESESEPQCSQRH